MDVVAWRRSALYALAFLLLPLLLLRIPTSNPAPAPQRAEAFKSRPGPASPAVGTRRPWTLTEARAALDRQPDNAYLQYVVLQLARNEKRLAAVVEATPALQAANGRSGSKRFDLWTTTHDVQAALQREAFLGAPRPPDAGVTQLGWKASGQLIDTVGKVQHAGLLASYQPAVPFPAGWQWATGGVPGADLYGLYVRRLNFESPSSGTVSVRQLAPPALPARPWQKWLGDQSSPTSVLSHGVPADFYFAEFRSLAGLLDALDAGHTWAAFLSLQAGLDSADRRTRQRVQTQLALDAASALQPFVEQVAVAGSDPFVQEGSDVTVLFQVKDPQAFDRRLEGVLDRVLREHPDARRADGKVLGVDTIALTTPDRRVSVHAATPRPGLHVRSNSPVALRRVLETLAGRVPALGDTAEFRYVRSLLPANAGDVDGLLYFPEAFVRRLVSPELQLAEARRLVAYNHLRMIGHAAQLYRTQFGTAPASLDELTAGGCAPGPFNQGPLTAPDGGTYALSADATFGIDSVHGTTEFLTPCCELAPTDALADEAEAYRAFADEFARSERHAVNPVAVRLHAGPHRARAEVVVLTTPDNPLRGDLADALGDAAGPLDPLPAPRRAVASVGLRWNREVWIKRNLTKPSAAADGPPAPSAFPAGVPWQDLAGTPRPALLDAGELEKLGIAPAQVQAFLQSGIGEQVSFHLCDADLPVHVNLLAALARLGQDAAAGRADRADLGMAFAAGALLVPAYVAVPVKDARVVDDFLAHLDRALAAAPTWRSSVLGVPVRGDFYHLTKGDISTRALGVRVGPARLRCFFARINDGLYVANQPGILDDLRTTYRARTEAQSADAAPTGQAMVRLRLANLDRGLPGARLGLEEDNRTACCRNLTMLSAAARAFSFAPPVAAAPDQETRQRLVLQHASRLYGLDFACPDGGQYVLAPDGRSFRCTVHGSPEQPTQTAAPATSSPTTRVLDGLTDVTATVAVVPAGLRVVITADRK